MPVMMSAAVMVAMGSRLEVADAQVDVVQSMHGVAAGSWRPSPIARRYLVMGTIALAAHTMESAIHVIRGRRVILDEDIAMRYGVSTRRLNEAMKRNAGRFPDDSMQLLAASGVVAVRSHIAAASPQTVRPQSATASKRTVRFRPRAFTEQGVAMLASIPHSPRAIAVDIESIRVFVRLRQALAISAELGKRLAIVEAKLDLHRAETGKALAEHESSMRVVFETIR
jgi:hypothetical protein